MSDSSPEPRLRVVPHAGGDNSGPPDAVVDLLYRVNTHIYDSIYSLLPGMDLLKNKRAYAKLMRDFWDARTRGFEADDVAAGRGKQLSEKTGQLKAHITNLL